ncbi:MAG: sigma-70 family RNA polymerase sigma factor [Bacteroidales bacterium]|nr:sigma-70 family RNA polymerase sigma factor [Bacteroidales bacterium]
MITENEIIEGCLKNDRKMQKVLYERFSSRMYSICLRYAKDKAEADDILQEGFLKIFTKIHQFSREHSFEGWMKRIFVNTSITNYRQNTKYYEQLDVEEIRESDITSFHVDDAEFTKEELLNVVKELSEGYKMVFNLFAIEGYKHREIAEILGIDIATSKSQFHRARKIIQTKLMELSKEKIQNV